jgi:hypothetical protein
MTPPPTVPAPNPPTDATLILDTRKNERTLGARGFELQERRLLFHAPQAHIELRLPPMVAIGGDAPWLYGQFVEPEEPTTSAGRVQVTMLADRGDRQTVEASDTGDFAMPCDPQASFWLECKTPGGALVRIRYEA